MCAPHFLTMEYHPQVDRDDELIGRLGGMPSQLIFIMGCHRSGTTFLHHLLATCGSFDFLSAYEVIRYPTILHNRVHGLDDQSKSALQAELVAEGPNRGIDQVEVDVNAPEEYGFVLPGYDLFVPRITPDNQPLFETLCRKKRWLKGVDQPLLLKEPNEFYGNLQAVQQFYPDATFIINHRHPLTVLASHIASWSSVYDEKNAYLYMLNPRYRQIMDSPIERMHHRLFMHTEKAVELVLNQLIRAFDDYLVQREQIESSPCFTLRYEDLCSEPDAIISDLLAFLDRPQKVALKERVSRRMRPAPDVVQRVYERNLDRLRPYLDALEYDAYPSATCG
jgi:hypothetical protein